MEQITVHIEVITEGVTLPFYANPGDAGMDVCAAETVEIRPGQTVVVKTGLKMAIPEGYEVQIRPRSGLSFHTPLRIPNSPGTIDSGYRDELGIIMSNAGCACCSDAGVVHTVTSKGNQQGTYKICKGDRIAQMVLMPLPRMVLRQVDDVSTMGKNRGGGFGSSGMRVEAAGEKKV